MGEWECDACGFISDGETPPSVCPDCGAPRSRFTFYAYLDDSDWDEEMMPDGEIEEEYTSADPPA